MVGEKRLWKLDQGLCVLLMLLIPLQLCLSIANLFYGIDKGYGHSFPLWSYVLSAAYLCVVLSADGFMICVGRLELSKFVGRYWLSACLSPSTGRSSPGTDAPAAAVWGSTW